MKRLKLWACIVAGMIVWECVALLVWQTFAPRLADPLTEAEVAERQEIRDAAARYRQSLPYYVARLLGPEHASAAVFSVDVTDRGVIGDGTTNDSTKLQAAVTSLNLTGGAAYLPADNRVYKLDSSIDIRSRNAIFVVSQMGTSAGIINSNISAKKGYIRPGATITNGLFRWRKPADAASDADCGGGGMIGVTIADVDVADADFRAFDVDSAIYLEQVVNWTMRDCYIQQIKGSGLRMGVASTVRLCDSRFYACGNTSQPSLWLDGSGPMWADTVFVEESYLAAAVQVDSTCSLTLDNGYFEGTQSTVHINANGVLECHNTSFGATSAANAVVISGAGAAASLINRCNFSCTPTAETIYVDAQQCRLSGIRMNSGQTGAAITFTASAIACQASDLYLYNSGRIVATAPNDTRFSNVNILASTSAAGTYALDIGNGNAVGVTINGNATQVAHGIRMNFGSIIDAEVYNLNNANAITTTVGGRVHSARAFGLNGGSEFVFGTSSASYVGLSDSNNQTEFTASELTIASGAITKTAWKRCHTIDTEADAASDDLNTINGLATGETVTFTAANDARSIVFKHATGNIQCAGGADLTLDSVNDTATVYFNGTKAIVTLHNGGAWITPAERLRAIKRTYFVHEAIAV